MKNKENRVANLLKSSGFSDKETAIYLGLLEIGQSTVSEISRASGVARTHCYLILNDLSAKGLVSVLGKEPKQEFIAESPVKIKEYIENKLLDQQKIFSEIKEIIPDLISKHKKGDRPRVRFYEGIDGLKTVYEDTLSTKENIVRGFVAYDELHKALPKYFPTYYKRRANRKLLGRAIVTDTEIGQERIKHNTEESRESIFVPKEYYFIPEIDIYDNKIMIASWREKLGIIIESEEISDAMKKIFELAWIGAREVGKSSAHKE